MRQARAASTHRTSGGHRRGELQPRPAARTGRGRRGCRGTGYQFTNATGTRNVSALTTSVGVDRERVLRHRVAAVGERVGELGGVAGPELDARAEHEQAARRSAAPRRPASTPAIATRAGSQSTSTTLATRPKHHARPGRSGRPGGARTRRRTPAPAAATGRTIIASRRAERTRRPEPLDVADQQVRDAEADRRGAVQEARSGPARSRRARRRWRT